MKINKLLIIYISLFMTTIFADDLKKLNFELSSPVGMAFNSKGELFIANWGNSTIKKYKNGSIETITDKIPSPSGLAINDKDEIFVASYSNGKIYTIDKNYNVKVFISGLSTIAGLYFDLDGNLLVAHRGNSEVLVISKDKKIKPLTNVNLTTPVGAIQIDKSRYIINDITGKIYLYEKDKNKTSLLSDKLRAPAIGMVYIKDKNMLVTCDYGGRGVYTINLDTKTTKQIENTIRSTVALAFEKNFFIGSWGDDSLYELQLK